MLTMRLAMVENSKKIELIMKFDINNTSEENNPQ